ncbi:MAG: insulinase family protein [Bacteroidetes bacterium]|nr:insulinase family protein [Bacteroidota bacterium]
MTDRSIQPEVVIPQSINIVATETIETKNGVKIYRLDNEGYDVIRISFVYRGGVTQQKEAFTASATLNNIAEGTEKRNSKELADYIDFYGFIYDVSIDMDYSIITICTLKRFANEAIELMGELCSTPIFPSHELSVYIKKKKQSMSIQRAKISYLAQEYFQKTIFGEENYYGRIFQPEDYDNLSSDNLKTFFKENYTQENMFVVVSGDSTEEEISSIKKVINSLPQGTKKEAILPKIKSEKEFYLEKKDAVQSSLKMGRILFDKSHEDFVGMQIVAKILGGYFGSRLIMNLREDKGYTYGIFANVSNTDTTGYFIISGEVIAEFTEDSIKCVFDEIKTLQTELVSDEELAMVKNVMIGEVMRILDGPFGIADATIENIQNKKDNSNLNDLIKEIRETDAERIRSLSKKYLQKEDLSVVVVGKK